MAAGFLWLYFLSRHPSDDADENRGALGRLRPDATRLQPIVITVDPERDTPDVMEKYTEAFDPHHRTHRQSAADRHGEQSYGAYSEHHRSGRRRLPRRP